MKNVYNIPHNEDIHVMVMVDDQTTGWSSIKMSTEIKIGEDISIFSC
jgi:hypothetical protein